MKEEIQCKCGKRVAADSMETLNEIAIPEPKVICVVRRFQGTCPNCGPFHYDKVGHHDTIGEKEMTRLFPRRKQLRKALSSEERKRFDQSMSGRREPKEEEVRRWL